MLRVYTASKLSKADVWRDLCAKTPELFFHARWLKHTKIGTPDTAANAVEFWLQDQQDVRDADAVIVWGDEGQHLRGALIEAGMALAYGVPVIVVGDHPDYGTWRWHPGVTRVAGIDGAILAVTKLNPRYRGTL